MECLKQVYESLEAYPRCKLCRITFHYNRFISFKTPYIVQQTDTCSVQKVKAEFDNVDIKFFRRHKFEDYVDGQVCSRHYTMYVVFVDRYDIITLCTIPDPDVHSVIFFHKYPGMDIEDLSRFENSKTWFTRDNRDNNFHLAIPYAPIFGMCFRLQSFLSSAKANGVEGYPICRLCGVCCVANTRCGRRWNYYTGEWKSVGHEDVKALLSEEWGDMRSIDICDECVELELDEGDEVVIVKFIFRFCLHMRAND